jgi:hypothetical protein
MNLPSMRLAASCWIQDSVHLKVHCARLLKYLIELFKDACPIVFFVNTLFDISGQFLFFNITNETSLQIEGMNCKL